MPPRRLWARALILFFAGWCLVDVAPVLGAREIHPLLWVCVGMLGWLALVLGIVAILQREIYRIRRRFRRG